MNLKLKIFTFLLVFVLLTTIPFADVKAVQQSSLISSGSWGARYWIQITSNPTTIIKPIYESQALHTHGYSTTIGVDSSKTNTCSANLSLTAGVDAVFATFSATMGVSTSQAFTTGASVTYGINESVASGRYRIEHIFPTLRVIQQKVLITIENSTVEWTRTILNAPKTNEAYRQLNRYANP